MDLEKFKEESQNRSRANKALLEKLHRRKQKNLDDVVHQLHHDAFDHTDCLKCANCCKTTSPIVIDRDIDRIAKHLKMKPSLMIEQYLHLDDDGDYVFRETPCPFLMPDNYCTIYEVRPRACREYPHTDRARFHQILKLTWRNTLVCPAVLEIVERLKGSL
ncbi:YkgJ family cysteine cluster protein [Marinilabilia sp.]|uniref:YkgJ family cysteine cluster protein n=1 Tax=Marinilabilia sp. TaxID=2021252 RepID=UPI0025BFA5B0|nr:YkgJ family cysteine cluster protein [Marinilabilia sp.]